MKKWLIIFMCLAITGCAGLSANLDTGTRILGPKQQIMVFPFRNPSYQGQELTGIGDSFTNAFWAELQRKGISATVAPAEIFSPTKMVNPTEACRYGKNQGADVVLLGVVTEWIDGATNWSGKRDVAAATVSAYTTNNYKLLATASGRQNGTFFTFVNASPTRFLTPLSGQIIGALFQ